MRGDQQTFVHRGITFQVEHRRDDYHGAPWDCGDDGRGVVTDWLRVDQADQSMRHLKQLGRWDHGTSRYFDIRATRRKARKEGWGLGPAALAKLAADKGRAPTPGEITDRAVELEYDFLNGWCSDEWEYVGVIVTLPASGAERSLWGIEGCEGDHLAEVARELADELIGDIGTEKEIAARVKVLEAERAAILAAREAGRSCR